MEQVHDATQGHGNDGQTNGAAGFLYRARTRKSLLEAASGGHGALKAMHETRATLIPPATCTSYLYYA